jgi:hypothetical protein
MITLLTKDGRDRLSVRDKPHARDSPQRLFVETPLKVITRKSHNHSNLEVYTYTYTSVKVYNYTSDKGWTR